MRKAVGTYPAIVRLFYTEVLNKLCLVTLSAFILAIVIVMEIRTRPPSGALPSSRPSDMTPQAEGVEIT
jgi:hypothetical protein